MTKKGGRNMKVTIEQSEKIKVIVFPLIAFLLLFSTLAPGLAAASEGKHYLLETNAPTLKAVLSDQNESTLKESGTTLTLTLEGAEWAVVPAENDSVIMTEEKKKVLIDSLKANDQSAEWEKIKAGMTVGNPEYINPEEKKTEDKNKVIKISIPKSSNIKLVKDLTVSLQIPHQLLAEAAEQLPMAEFTIKAQPKVLISGSATSISPVDFAKGGKEIILTLVGAKWKSNVASNTLNREKLIGGFNWGMGVQNEINARGTVRQPTDETVVITLPSITEKVAGEISFLPENIEELVTSSEGSEIIDFLIEEITPAIKFEKQKDAEAIVSGTIQDNTNEFDIVKGGKTVTLTLKGDVWADDINKDSISISAIPTITIESGKRINDSTATFTLAEQTNFMLEDNQTFSITVNKDALKVSSTQISILEAFVINSVIAELSGTAAMGMDAKDVVKGGKTIIITLKNTEFITGANPSFNDIFTDSNPWSEFATGKDIQISKNKMTIKLPSVPNYISGTNLEVTVPTSLMVGGPSEKNKVKVAGSINMGATAGVVISATSISESSIRKGGGEITLDLKIANWDPSIATEKSKKVALLKGFSTDNQVNEWKKVTTAIVESGAFSIEEGILKIVLPVIPEYSLIRNQEINITIPKSVLTNYKDDIEGNSFIVTIPDDGILKPFAGELNNLTNMIKVNGLEKIRVKVPEKHVYTVTTSVAKFGEKVITTLEVKTSGSVQKMKATVDAEGIPVEASKNGAGTFIFVFDNIDKDSVVELSTIVGGKEVAKIYQKIPTGKKTFTKIPKDRLDGSYSLYTLLTDSSLLNNILKFYTLEELLISTTI